jgi:DNA-binding transcriptional ArsR family regulator
MRDVHVINTIDDAIALLKPVRIQILHYLSEPRTCPQLADFLNDSAQKIYYHIKALEKAGVVEKVDEKRVRGTVEGHYQAVARSYWLAPQVVGKIGGDTLTRDQVSLRMLLSLTEDIQHEVGRLGMQAIEGIEISSLSVSGLIHLADAQRRAEFMQELQTTFETIARKYGIPESVITQPTADYRLILMCYPKPDASSVTPSA